MSKFNLYVAFLCISLSSTIFSIDFKASQKLSKIEWSLINGTCLPEYNGSGEYDKIAEGLKLSKMSIFRFPDGNLANEYQWNATGKLDSESNWCPDSVIESDGFSCISKYRGTTSGNRPSYAMDGDTNTFWWSDPEITESDPYLYCTWKSLTSIDSVVVKWGDHYSSDFKVQIWDKKFDWIYPHMNDVDEWKTVAGDSSGKGGTSVLRFDPVNAYALRIISHKEYPSHDIKIKEFYAYSKGKQVTVNVSNSTEQTQNYASSTHPGIKRGSQYQWSFKLFMNYLDSLGYPTIPVICTNYGTGNEKQAAAWVYYANIVKKYKIIYWQVGNENDGEWVAGGPVSAFTYSEKFLRFAKAMKAVDSTIKIMGPLLSQPKFDGLSSGEYNSKTWLESFIMKVGEAEKKDKRKYLDVVDFHCYPYWFDNEPRVQEMALSSDTIYNDADSMLTWINRYLLNPDSVKVMMSEYNSTVLMTSLLQNPVNAMVVADMNASLIYKMGYRAMSIIWSSIDGFAFGPDGTCGTLSLFNDYPSRMSCSLKAVPSSIYWGNYMVTNVWLDPESDNYLIESDSCKSGQLRYYGNTTSHDTRVLVINLSNTDSSNVDVKITGANYSNVEVISWGAREFTWHGTDDNAYAMPNCGPSSYRMAKADYVAPKIPPMSAIVLRFFDSDSVNALPQKLLYACENKAVSDTDTLKVSVSYRAKGGTIDSIAYALDSAVFRKTDALDGRYDGQYENSLLKIPASNMCTGDHKLLIRAISGSKNVIDTIKFSVSKAGSAIKFVNFSKEVKSKLVINDMNNGKFHLKYNPSMKGLSYIKIFTLNGELVGQFTSMNAPVEVTWGSGSLSGHRFAGGSLLVKAGIKGAGVEARGILRILK